MKVFLIVGACGSGKTWIMEQVVKDYKLKQPGKVGLFYFHRSDKIVVLGKYDGSVFQGSDKLSMAVMKDVNDFKKWVEKNNMVVVCEGDRFMNSTFVDAFKTKVTIIAIEDDGAKGRKKRKSKQTERQIKSIQTRVNKFKLQAKHQVIDSSIAYKVLKDELKDVA